MPIYEYRCHRGHVFEVMQSMTDDPISQCRECGSPVERVFHPVAVRFRGSGFYTTDYGKGSGGGRKAESSDAGSTKGKDQKKPADGKVAGTAKGAEGSK